MILKCKALDITHQLAASDSQRVWSALESQVPRAKLATTLALQPCRISRGSWRICMEAIPTLIFKLMMQATSTQHLRSMWNLRRWRERANLPHLNSAHNVVGSSQMASISFVVNAAIKEHDTYCRIGSTLNLKNEECKYRINRVIDKC